MTATLNGARVVPPVYAVLPEEPVRLDKPQPPTGRRTAVTQRLTRLWAVVLADFHRWWLFTAHPPTLASWLAGRAPLRVPEDNARLRWAWTVDHWVTGLPMAACSVGCFLAAAGLRWVACHPARRWTFILLAAVCAAWVWSA